MPIILRQTVCFLPSVSCQAALNFSSRDLLQKHHSTYHEVRDPLQVSGGEPPISSRTPIACSNCATAKAGCDKKVPCSRCADKNLPCAPRFARRTSKGSIARAAAANGSPTTKYQSGTQTRASSITESSTEDQLNSDSIRTQSQADVPLWVGSHKEPVDSHGQAFQYAAPAFEMIKSQGGVVNVDDFLGNSNGDFDPQGIGLESINGWTNGSLDIDMCASEGIDFSSHSSMLYFPSNIGLGENLPDPTGVPLPSPSGSTSLSHSRTNSSSNIWQARIEPQLQEQVLPFAGPSNGVVPELPPVVAGDEGWPFMRCNPRLFAGSCPRTAMVHLQKLQNNSKMEEGWNTLGQLMLPNDLGCDENSFSIVPLQTTTRDKIIAFAQSFLLKALRTHQSELSVNSSPGGVGSFFTLPPSNVLENLLRSSVHSLSPYYSLSHGTMLDPNELMLDNETSTLLFLLMIAQGANSIPRADGRFLAGGLTETCRISLFDVIEKNVELSADPVVLKSAFLLTMLCSWGGDAWHIKMAMGGQRGMYLAVS